MAKTKHTPRIVVLGIGNLLLKDEGIGVHIAHALQGTPPPAGAELDIIDGGTLPDAPLLFEEVDKLIVVDAVQGGDEPGSIYRFHPEDIRLDSSIPMSLHQINLLENLWMMERFTQKPKDIVIIGVQPEDMRWGLELSPELQRRVPRIIEVVLREAHLDYPENSGKGESQNDNF